MMTSIYQGFETLLNAYLRLDPDSLSQLPRFAGKTLALHLKGLNAWIYITCTPDRLRILSSPETQCDASITGTPLTLSRLFFSSQKATFLFSGEVVVTGDMAFAEQFSDFLAQWDIDWEEQLSKFTGDVCAHEIGRVARTLQSIWKSITTTVQKNTAEYFQEELRCFISREELNDFCEDVDHVRNDVERLTVRIQHILTQGR